MNIQKLPYWTQQFYEELPLKQQFVFHGNVYDFFPFYKEGAYITHSLVNYTSEVLQYKGYESVIKFDPIRGFTLLHGEINILKSFGFLFDEQDNMQVPSLDTAYFLIKKLLFDTTHAHAVVFEFASHIQHLSSYKNDYNDFLLNLFYDSFTTLPVNSNDTLLYNQVIFLLENKEDLPQWYNNTRIQYLKVPKPDHAIRHSIIKSLFANMKNLQESATRQKDALIPEIVAITDNMYSKEILNTLLLANKENPDNLIEFILQRKLKAPQNPWLSLNHNTYTKIEESLREIFVKNLDDLINEIKSAYFNLSSIETTSFLCKPRSTMIFTGNNQETQHEVLEQLALSIFKNKNALYTIDMNLLETENISLHSHVEHFPYGILMFENIQNANQKSLKTILNIIENGSIVEESETLYFHGYIVILGYTPLDNGSKELTHQKLQSNFKEIFTRTSKSTLYSKLESKTIFFNLLNKQEAKIYLEKQLGRMLTRIELLRQIKIILRDEVTNRIVDKCLTTKTNFKQNDLNILLTQIFLIPFVNYLSECNLQKNDIILLKDLSNNKFTVELA